MIGRDGDEVADVVFQSPCVCQEIGHLQLVDRDGLPFGVHGEDIVLTVDGIFGFDVGEVLGDQVHIEADEFTAVVPDMQILVVSPELAGIAAVQLGVEVIDGDMISDGIVVDELDYRPGIAAPASTQEDQIGSVLLQQPRQLLIGDGLDVNLLVRGEDLLFRFLIISQPDVIRTAEAAELRFGSCVKNALPGPEPWGR